MTHRPKWQVQAAEAGTPELDHLLSNGWEPFAVVREAETTSRPGMYEEEYTTHYSDVVWVRLSEPA